MKFFVVFALALVSTASATYYSVKSPSKSGFLPSPPTKQQQQQQQHTYGPVTAAVYTTRHLEYLPVAVEQSQSQPQYITVEPSNQAVHFLFKSQSSPLLVRQQHIPSASAQYESTRSEDQPHVLRHEVLKPVIQELRETIQPYRRIIQEIKPVHEEVRTLVSKGQYYQQQQQHQQVAQFPEQQQQTQQQQQQDIEQGFNEEQLPQLSQTKNY